MTRELSGPEVAALAEAAVPGSVAKTTETACYLKPEHLVQTLEALKTSPEADLVHLTNLCGVDFWDHMEVVYHIQSFVQNHIALFKVEAWDREKPEVPSVTPVFWPAGRNRGSYSGEKIRGSHCGASAASRASGGTHA